MPDPLSYSKEMRQRNIQWHMKNSEKYYIKRQFRKSFYELERAMAFDPSDPTILFYHGILCIELNKLETALNDFTQVIQIVPHFFQAYARRAETQNLLGNFHAGLADALKALEINPDSTEAMYSQGVALASLEDSIAAIEVFTKLIVIEPNIAVYHFNRGVCYSKLGDFKNALDNYNKTIELHGKHAWAHFYRADANRRLGNTALIESDLDKAQKFGLKINFVE